MHAHLRRLDSSISVTSFRQTTSINIAGEVLHLFDGCVHGELRGLSLGLAEDDGPAVAAAVHLDDVTDD